MPDAAASPAVIPRGCRIGGAASLPIDQLLLPIIRGKVNGIVLVIAPPGGGKTTAIAHLRTVLPAEAAVQFVDSEHCESESPSQLIVLAVSERLPVRDYVDVLAISPWTRDDCMQYLVASHRAQCKSVLDRLAGDSSFDLHMGSTRSGLVGSVIAGEGSRTGFYTDDFKDQLYKNPEEIRKACLCGANLLFASAAKTDFYLVDLRRAVYSPDQAEHFVKSGAILSGG